MAREVTIDQASCITPLGDTAETVEALFQGHSGIRHGPFLEIPVGYAPFQNPAHRLLPDAAQILKQTCDLSEIDPGNTILIYCSAKGELAHLEHWVNDNSYAPPALTLLDDQANSVASLFGSKFSKTLAISNACASGAIALETAAEFLSDRDFAHALLIGFEPLCRFVVSGFHSLGALSPERARPFDEDRNGLSPGECAGIVLLSYREPETGDIVISGAGSSNDANHRTGPSRTGDGLFGAAKAACKNASRDFSQIGGVKCHGTATLYNDAMEAKALFSMFGTAIPPCVSLKGAIGHGSGAGSLCETILASHFIRRMKLPPTYGFMKSGVEEPVQISAQPQSLHKPVVLCLSAGFGGVNGAVILEKSH
ncbi:MAG: hypothetical protein GF350_07155 [Chitinivibrionales bacterium]|nr:hypothetical protein [Chitinivibrionales bacterium]